MSALPRAYRIEQAEKHDRQVGSFVVSQGQEFVEFLRGGVAPSALERRAERAIIVYQKSRLKSGKVDVPVAEGEGAAIES